MLKAQPKLPEPDPNRPGGPPGRSRRVACAPRERAPRDPRPPLLVLLGVQVGEEKGAGTRGSGGAALGGTPGFLESY